VADRAAGEKQAREFVLANPEMAGLADLTPEDIVGSPYAVQEYKVHSALGGPAALAALRAKLAEKGIGLLLDFVPNHTALDHPWVHRHPEFYVQGTEDDMRSDPHSFCVAETARGRRVLAHGRDPTFPPGRIRRSSTTSIPPAAAMIKTLLEVAEQRRRALRHGYVDLQDIFAAPGATVPGRRKGNRPRGILGRSD
jgi:hypothetical protein